MRLKDFLKTNKIPVPEFAEACGCVLARMRTYVYETRKPPLHILYRIIVQSGCNVTLEDFIDDENKDWSPKKRLETKQKIIVGGLDTTSMRKHERKKYFDDIENI